jgi:hypothetical protein
MIVYDLQCRNGHTFEGWFEDAKAFKKQQKTNLIACPVCNDTQVTRIPSTFAIKGSAAARKLAAYKNETASDLQMDQMKMARTVTEFFEKNFDNVGSDFASEALKMHYGVKEPRNIRGVSTSQEEETLRKEGVEFVKFPLPARISSSSESDA